jgi:putative ABC transport system permease protein
MEKIKEYFKIAFRNLKTRQLRSWLTMIGVIIGVFLIVSLMSLSEGLKSAVMQQLRMMGKDIVMIMPGDIADVMNTLVGGSELTNDDIRTIRKVKGVESVVEMDYKTEVMRHEGEKKTVLIYGNPWDSALKVYQEDMGWTLKEGRWPIPGKNELLVGSLVPEEIFPGMEIGDQATIKGRKFKIVGVLNSIGSKQDDSMIAMELSIFRAITGEREGAKMAMAKVEAGYSAEQVVEAIKEDLEENSKRRRGEDSSSFTVLSSEKISNIVGDVMGLIQVVIFGFASIAIIVGAIGIMNTMYTSVHERIKEIGIMKAIGAKSSTITAIFLIESGIFGLFGGLGGTILGIGLAKTIEIYFQFHPVFYMQASASPFLILFALTFSFLVGCISGFLPARRASKLKPVDALRYE